MVVVAAVVVVVGAAVVVTVTIKCPITCLDRPLGFQEVEGG